MSRPNLKRKAEQQLTRLTAEEPNQETQTTYTFQTMISRVTDICRSIYNPIYNFFFAMPADMGQGSAAALRRLPAIESRKCDNTSLRKAPATASLSYKKSRSVVDTSRRAGRGKINIAKCKGEEEARKRLDKYWEPPELGFLRPKLKYTPKQRPSTPESLPEGWDQERRHSDPSVILGNSRISSASPEPRPSGHHASKSSTSLGQPPATPESLPGSFPQTPRKVGTLVESLKNLFVDDSIELPCSDHKAHELERIKQEAIRAEVEREKKALKEAVEAAIKAAKDRRLGRQYPLKALVEPLDSKWDSIVSNALLAPGDRTLTTSLEGTELRLKDFNTLLGHRAWLNDEIINTYIEWVVAAANEAAAAEAKAFGEELGTVPKFIAHNSFFYSNLRTKGPSSTDRLMKRKKAPGDSLMKVDTVFVPICQGSHWTVGVVRPVAKTIEYFDSMGGSHTEFVRQMRGWLKHQLGPKYKDEEWTTPKTACAVQTNGYDCGVFVCTNAFCVASGIDTSCYEQQDMTLQRRRIAAILINRGFKKDFQWGREGLLPIPEYLQCGPDGVLEYFKQKVQELRPDDRCGTRRLNNFERGRGGLVSAI